MFEIGVRAHDIKENNIVSLTKKLGEMNITTIQLALQKSIEDIDFGVGKFSPCLARKIKKELDKNGVSISVLGSYINPVINDEKLREQEINKFIENLKYAKYLGADLVGTETGNLSDFSETSSENTYQVFLDSIRKILAVAKNLGVRIGIEGVCVNTINTPKKMKRFLDDIDSQNVGVILDLVNYLDINNYKNQKEILDQAFDLFGDRIEVIHLKDFKVCENTLCGTKFGSGNLDYKYLLKTIKERKPYLPIIIEGQPQEDFNFIRDLLLD